MGDKGDRADGFVDRAGSTATPGMRMIGRTRIGPAAAALLAAGLVAGIGAQAATGESRGGSGGPPPRVIQLSYRDSRDGSFPRFQLEAFARRTDKVSLSTRYEGKRAKAKTRFNKSVSDTDIKGKAQHPFVLVRKGGGRRVIKLVRESLDERGQARVRVRASSGGRVDAIALRIVLARCSMDPPIFPVDCEVRRSGKHV